MMTGFQFKGDVFL